MIRVVVEPGLGITTHGPDCPVACLHLRLVEAIALRASLDRQISELEERLRASERPAVRITAEARALRRPLSKKGRRR